MASETAQPTFKRRVEQFWTWYGSVAERFYATINAKRCPELANEVSEAVALLGPHFAWVFGPGENGGHSFTLSGEGNAHAQFLAQYWKRLAPRLTGWTFYDSRQPGSADNIVLDFGKDGKFSPHEFWVSPFVDEQAEKIDIHVWHPMFTKLADRERWKILYIFLDEVLGEINVEAWIGKIEMTDKTLGQALPITELREFIENLKREREWKKYPPGESVSLYQVPSNDDATFPRSDIFVGQTRQMRLIQTYLESKGDMEDPLAQYGAAYIYLEFPSEVLRKGAEAHHRGEIEDALEEALASSRSGLCLGGAMGRQNAYIDLLIFDGTRSIQLIQEQLPSLGLPTETRIRYFGRKTSACNS